MNGSHFLLLEITTTESLMQKMLSLISQISLLSNGLKLTRYRFTHKVSVFSDLIIYRKHLPKASKNFDKSGEISPNLATLAFLFDQV